MGDCPVVSPSCPTPDVCDRHQGCHLRGDFSITDVCSYCGFAGRDGHATGCPTIPPPRLHNAMLEGDAADEAPNTDEPDTAGVITERDAERMKVAIFGPDTAMVLPSDSFIRKQLPIFNGFLRYFPRACAAVSHLSLLANEKHNPGEPLHWSENKSSDHLDALTRHLIDAGRIDPEFGLLHDVGLAWRAFANLETILKKIEQENKSVV
jgi:hypothetical protein